MLTNRHKQLVAFAFAAAFIFMAVSPALSVAADVPSDLSVGPYVDKLVYKVIVDPSQTILALQAGTIEMDNSFFNPSYLEQLGADPDISVFKALRNGYGHITINCDKYPLNISAFRRAFAYAFDKYAVTIDIMGGHSQEHDSLVPYPNGWCIEDDFTYKYYDEDVTKGEQILEDAGFIISGDTGFLLAPNGEPFEVIIEYGSGSEEIAGGTARIGVDALRNLGVNADSKAADFNEYISRLDSHGDYDMVFYAFNYYSNDIDWLADEYKSENADVPYQNPTNFRNSTYDGWIDQLIYSTTYDKVYEASAAMQEILHYNVPRLVVYENEYMQGYRNDVFKDHVEDLGRYISGPWTMRNIKKIDGTFGGTVTVSLGQEPDSFNIYVTNSAYAAAINSELWSSLYTFGPDLNPWPDLAESFLTETHDENPEVPLGHTRFTIDIIQNATWSDGVKLTAADVAFTQTYALESAPFGNPAGTDTGDLVAAYAPTPYRVVIEYNTESYWHFGNWAYDSIIPQHVFNDVDGIGYEGWNTWNPVFDPDEPNVNCGPYQITDIEAGEFYELTYNADYHYCPEHIDPTTTATTTPTEVVFDMTLAIVAGAVGAAVVILVGGFVLLRQK
jgi:ABC-type transport system substrate-binding protein